MATEFETHPSRYHHWKLSVDGEVATLLMKVDDDAERTGEPPTGKTLAERLGRH